MANTYNNLKGWLRDVRSCYESDNELYEELIGVMLNIDAELDCRAAEVAPEVATDDDSESADDGDSNDVDGDVAEPRQQSLPAVGGPTPRRASVRHPPSGLGSPLGRVARDLGVPEERLQSALRLHGVGAAGKRVCLGVSGDGES